MLIRHLRWLHLRRAIRKKNESRKGKVSELYPREPFDPRLDYPERYSEKDMQP